MEKFAQFGVEPVLLLAQIVNFLVLLYLLKRFLYKPVLEMLRRRETKIREGLEAGVKGEELLEKARKEEKEILVKAQEEANSVLEETRERALHVEEELLTKAKGEADGLIVHARAEIELEREQAVRLVEKKAVDSAVSILERILPKVLTRTDHMRILTSSEKMLRKVVSP